MTIGTLFTGIGGFDVAAVLRQCGSGSGGAVDTAEDSGGDKLTTKTDYTEFLERKRITAQSCGFTVAANDLNPALFPFQRDIVQWACQRGRAAMFCDCGMGKTIMQLEWARLVCQETGGNVLILAPLAVSAQTASEGAKFGIPVTICREQADVRPGINVTNYERLHKFDAEGFDGVVLDESSILKAYTGKTKQELISRFSLTPYRLACTATPAPNDHLELGNHAEFLGVMRSNEMIMRWFINDTMEAGGYRLKGHAAKDYWKWVSSWAVSLSKPSDLGYDDGAFILPTLHLATHIVDVDFVDGQETLMRNAALSATNLHREMRLTCEDRAKTVANLVNDRGGSWLIWCNTNYEADALREVLPQAVEVRGSDSPEQKEAALMGFARGDFEILLSKPSICGFGMNFQRCHQMAFVGLSYSFEMLYQALRRSWRYGQEKPVEAHIVIAESEGDILRVIQKKQAEHEEMKRAMNEAMSETRLTERGSRKLYAAERDCVKGHNWALHLGDSCEVIRDMESDSIGFSVFSPPFANLYIYSDSIADMGNCKDEEEFFAHFQFLIQELYRVTMPGRLCAVHCKDLPLYAGRDGAAGLKDFPGEITRQFEACGWTYHSRVTIWKDPVIEMQRTKNHGLLYKNLRENSCVSRQGMADYLVVFRKWLPQMESLKTNPVSHTKDEFPLDQWQKWASPVWMDINQTRVLNYQIARENSDEKHICPLQLDVIERAVALWSNPGDVVFSPFAGIGSEGYVAVQMDRKFVGVELKRAYWNIAQENLRVAEIRDMALDLFTGEEAA